MKVFTLEEARALLPILKDIISEANDELEGVFARLQTTNQAFQKAEKELASVGARSAGDEGLSTLRKRRANFQKAIDDVSRVQNEYLERLNYWVQKVTEKG